MELFVTIGFGVLLIAGLSWLRQGSNGGKFGTVVRNSDRLALEDAIDEKEQELQVLKSLRRP